jgi:dTDP-4-amino-4,6-dideoxygalactose transaminase
MNYSNKSINFYLKKYKLKDPWDLVDLFEKNVAHYTGSKYGIAVDCCTNAIFLSLKYLNSKKKLLIPKNTYISILSAITLANYNFRFVKKEWSGSYQIEPLPIYDSATKFTKDMYVKKTYMCLSFHHRKHIQIGRGGMILTDSKKAYNWFKKARYDGRDLNINYKKDDFKIRGWHMYMTPEQAAFGLELLKKFDDQKVDKANHKSYKDISRYKKLYK